MGSGYEDIIISDIFTFVIGKNRKEYKVHGAAISRLSKPLDVLLNGDMREAKAKYVKWPDVDEKTFVHFTEWAYKGTYETEEPDILLDLSLIGTETGPTETQATPEDKKPEESLYSLISTSYAHEQTLGKDCCWNKSCASLPELWTLDELYQAFMLESQLRFTSWVLHGQTLIHKFLNEITSEFSPRKNKEGCEDYTEVFLCHAKLYVMADIYDIPALKQLTLHRLHATLKEFTLYPSRMNDIATLAKYVFENTVPEDKIRDMMTLYYACIIEDAWKYDGLKSVIDGVPDFAFGLISQMSDRLA